MNDTIFAVSSGALPAAIAVLRISGPAAFSAGRALTGTLPPSRRAGLRRLRAADGGLLDHALVLAFPAPATATGEDLLELHLHGGRAIVRAVEAALAAMAGLRAAEPGEFTRRALCNGRIDLTQAGGLADLLAAETDAARRAALATADGAVSRMVAAWMERLVILSARTEALIDFADEDDVPAAPSAQAALLADIAALGGELAAAAGRPPVERLRDGVRVVLAGPPNSGKSSLLNALVGREMAIATPIPGTTRDRIEVPVIRDGVAYLLTDVAGLREVADDPIEAIGVARAREAMAAADLVVWLGDELPPDAAMLAIHPRCDAPGRGAGSERLAVSAKSGIGLDRLWASMADRAAMMLPRVDEVALNRRQLEQVALAAAELTVANQDLLIVAEHLRHARRAMARLSGAEDIDGLLDALFSRFCIGK